MRIIKYLYAIAILSFLFFFILCAKKVEKDFYVIGFSQYSSTNPLRIRINKSIFKEAENCEKDIRIKYKDAGQDPVKQKSDIEEFLYENADLVIVAPGEREIISAGVEKVYREGIPVIILDKMISTKSFTCFIGIDNVEVGRLAASYAVKIINGEGKIIEIQGFPEDEHSIDRSKGFREIIDGYENIEILYTDFAGWIKPLAITKMEKALRLFDTIDLVYAHNDAMAVGAYLASRSHERENRIIFVGIGGSEGENGGMQAVLDGKIDATVRYPTYGKEAIQNAVRIFAGQKVAKIKRLKPAIVTKENVESLLK
ncbi:substrate-binding domain-containing protein [bacterium]|nr:substrate-binding domain-containing protein [bacterium]